MRFAQYKSPRIYLRDVCFQRGNHGWVCVHVLSVGRPGWSAVKQEETPPGLFLAGSLCFQAGNWG